MDASLLAVCNVRGVLFAGAPGAPRCAGAASPPSALRSSWRRRRRLAALGGAAAAALVVALSCDGARLVVATEDGAASLALHLYDVAGLLRGAHAPAARTPSRSAARCSRCSGAVGAAADAGGRRVGGRHAARVGRGGGRRRPPRRPTSPGSAARRTPPTAPPSSSATPTAGSAAARAGDALGAAEELVGASALDAERAGAALAHVAPIGEGFVLLLHEADENDPLLASVWHVGAASSTTRARCACG